MPTYEESLGSLRETIEKLEGGSLTLEESLKLFQEGVEHISFCYSKLEEIRGKVELLLEDADGRLIREERAEDD